MSSHAMSRAGCGGELELPRHRDGRENLSLGIVTFHSRVRRSAIAAVVLLNALSAAAQTTAGGGPYTVEQAARGRDAYQKQCVRCHLADLAGDQLALALVGADFLARQSGSIGMLFSWIKENMPPDDPGSASDREYADIIAYVLSRNGIAAGPRELSSSLPELNQIPFQSVVVVR
jgi:mono/diheme cytochrome c family protein